MLFAPQHYNLSGTDKTFSNILSSS